MDSSKLPTPATATATTPASISRYDTITDAPAELWRAAVQDRFHCRPAWLAMLEANGLAQARRYSLLAGGEPARLGALCGYLLDETDHPRFQPLGLLTHDELVLPWLDRLPATERASTRDAVDRLAAAPLGRAAVSVAPFGYRSALLADGPDLLPALVDELDRDAAEWGCPTSAVLYVDHHDQALRAALTAAGYLGWVTGATAELALDWPSLDGYVASRRPHRRTKIRREMARFDASGITVAQTPLPEDTSVLAELAARHQEKHGHGFHPEFEDMVLQNYRKYLGPDCFVVAGYRAGRPVGYEIIFRDRDVWRAGLCGWDDSLSRPQEYAYFNVGYYRLIELALRDGATAINYGLEAYQAKLNRGCRLQPLWCFVKVPGEYRALASAVVEAHHRGMRKLLTDLEHDR